MPHIDNNILMFCGFAVVALFLLKLTQAPSNSAELQRLMSSGMMAMQQRDFAEAETHFERALKMLKSEKEPDVPKVVTCLTNLSQCYEESGKHKEAREVFKQIIADWDHHLRKGRPMVDIDYAATNSDLGRGTNEVAEFYINKVIPLRTSSLPPRHPDISNSYSIAARLLRKLGRNEEADQLELKAKQG